MLERPYTPLYGDLDPDFSVGLRSYLSWFQNIATEYINSCDLGNDVLPEKFGLYWVYTGYRLYVARKAGLWEKLTLRTWSSAAAPAHRLWQEFTVSNGDEILAAGRLGSCLLDIQSRRQCKAAPFKIPRDGGVNFPIDLDDLAISKDDFDAPCFQHTIRFSDLDASLHLNNLSAVNLLLDAFTAEELNGKAPLDFAVRYFAQCYENQTVTVHRRDEPEETHLILRQPDGTVAERASLRFYNQ